MLIDHIRNHLRCCYITVDSGTAVLQNGACTYRCISNQMHPFHKTPTWNLWKLHHSVLSGKKQTFLQYNINTEPCMAYYPKWLNLLFNISNNYGTTPFCHMLCLGMNRNVMQRFMVLTLQDPPLCSSTAPRTSINALIILPLAKENLLIVGFL